MRGVITFFVIVLALLVEYALTDGGVLRWIMSATATKPVTQAMPETPAAPEPQPQPQPRPESQSQPPPPPPPPAQARLQAEPQLPQPGTLPVSNSFEDENLDWRYDARGGDGFGARSGDAGRNSQHSLMSQASDGANRGWPGWRHDKRYPVTPGTTYVFRAHAVSPDGGNGWLDLQLYDKAGTWLGGRSNGCLRDRLASGGWTEMELRFTADDPKVASVELALLQCLNHSKGRMATVYFDDMSFGPQ